MKVKGIAALILGITVLTSGGCTRNPADELKNDKDQPIIEYNGIILYEDDVFRKMNYYLTPQGMTIKDLSQGADKEIWERFKTDIIYELSLFHLALNQAGESGLDELSSAEKQNIDGTYATGLEVARDAVQQAMRSTDNKDGIPDNDPDFARLLNEYFYLNGYDLETYKTTLEQEYIVGKVKEYYTRDVTVTDEEVRAKYDNDLEVQKSNLEKQPESIEQLLRFGAEVLYYPEGYMYAKHILVSFESEDRGAAAIAYVNGEIGKYNRIISEATPKIQPRIDMILQKLNDGADFDDLMVRYSDDSSLNAEPYKTRGFLIGPYTSFDLTEYLTALGTLKSAGEYTEPVTTYMGSYIIKCEEMLAGPVAYEEVRDPYKLTIVNQRKAYAWSALGQDWIDQAKAEGTLKQYPERL